MNLRSKLISLLDIFNFCIDSRLLIIDTKSNRDKIPRLRKSVRSVSDTKTIKPNCY